ncbi:hypothetical protein FNO01nite_25240 [Flavobacterium noncentrifugens]|uniref:Methyltransferase domain-containing protein n=1 Tax=Flavobacterium noncentrifugens TaxID=1128970 RepID=A0A1G8ZS50_9FLAO|nr:methyltransferase domain-containing protein [Flavobacterium noncentrifugens]GEP51852.1 hypothetical protein FNO01nite_25240 [Flavobacterium noncentrifugens]SDK17867.1 Methyltransferase domain-containing protein [Flavobacterium noncentrifugens]
MIDTTYRTDDPEIMDDFAMEGENLIDALDKIASINRLLGGNKITLDGVKSLIENVPLSQEIKIIDLGCGNGDMLRMLADFAQQENRNFKLIGIDANHNTILRAKELSTVYPNISYLTENVFSPKFENFQYDISLCTLTLHHFKEEELLWIMRILKRNSRIGIVINDLQRSALAYRLFQLLGFVFQLKKMPREDGLTSILRGFKKQELIDYSKKLQLTNYKIQWKWAFRYQWIISKT